MYVCVNTSALGYTLFEGDVVKLYLLKEVISNINYMYLL